MTGAVSLQKSSFTIQCHLLTISQTRPTRFGDFNTAPGKHSSDDRTSQSSTLGQKFGNGGSWQASGAIWGSNPIGSGFANAKRDASRSRGRFTLGRGESCAEAHRAAVNNDFERPSGSGALAESSEADPSWSARQNGPWNPDTTSPTIQSSHSGSTSPSAIRGNSLSSDPRGLLDIQNQYQQSRPAIGQGPSFSRTQPKSSLDPSSGPFKLDKPVFGFNDDKENSTPTFLSNSDSYHIEIPSRQFRSDQLGSQNPPFLGVGSSASRDGSMPPSRASDSGFNAKGLAFGNGNSSYGSIGHTPSSSIHSQRPSFSGPSGSYQSHANGSRYSDPDADLRDRLVGMRFDADAESAGVGSQIYNTSSYTHNSNTGPNIYPLNGGAGMWGDSTNAQKSFGRQENYSNQPFQDQVYYNKPQFGDRGSVSPAGSDYRRGLNSPNYYPVSGTPPSGSDQGYRPGSNGPRGQQGPNELERRLQNIHLAQQFYATYGQFPSQYPQHIYDYPQQSFRHAAVPYGYQISMPPYATQAIPTRPAKDQDIGAGVRSVLLEEFRSNSKSNKRYELKDLYDHVVEFSGDQHGSRFIQQKLETANSDEKEQLFREIQPNALQLMTDVFGNYVIQKLFEHGNQIQKKVLAEQMRNHVMELSMQMYGCRVVQKVCLLFSILLVQTKHMLTIDKGTRTCPCRPTSRTRRRAPT